VVKPVLTGRRNPRTKQSQPEKKAIHPACEYELSETRVAELQWRSEAGRWEMRVLPMTVRERPAPDRRLRATVVTHRWANLRMMRIIRAPFQAMDGRLSGPSPMKRDDGGYAEATDFITKEA
jgi:hypothetical protein